MPSVMDIREHLDALIFRGFLQQVPYEHLKDYPRYLKAILLRLEKAGQGLGVDPRRRDVAADPIDRQHHGGEQDTPAELRDAEEVGELLEQLDDLGGAAGRADLLRGLGAELVGPDRDAPVDGAFRQDLDAVTLPQTEARKHLGRELADVGEPRQVAQVDDDVLLLEEVGEAALRQPPVEGHLATFEVAPLGAPGTGLLTLVTLAGGLAIPGTTATTESLASRFAAFAWLNCIQSHF